MRIKKAYLAGWCFWWFEELFRNLDWVIDTQVWYMGGEIISPTYRNHEWHAEAIEVTYNPDNISYKNILDFFFRIHDPTTLDRQWNDIWSSYRSAIFYGDDEELLEAENFIELVDQSERWEDSVVTTLEEFNWFWPAEDEHQDYLQKYPAGYTCHSVRFGSYL